MNLIIALVVTTSLNDTSDEDLILEARTLFSKLNKITAGRAIAKVKHEVGTQMSKLEKLAMISKNLKAQYYIYKACDLYCIVYKKPHDRLSYLEKMTLILDRGNTDIQEREKALTKFKMADVLYDENKIRESYNFIYSYYKNHPRNFKNLLSGFHILIETAILLKNYNLAESILNKEFYEIILNKHEPYCCFAHLNYAKLYLHKGEYEKAIRHIIEIKNVAGQIPNALMEAQIRIYETMYFYLTDDLDFAGQLSSINEKFFEDQNISDRSTEINEVLKIITACITASLQERPLSKDIVESIKQYQYGPKAIYGELLKQMASGPSQKGL